MPHTNALSPPDGTYCLPRVPVLPLTSTCCLPRPPQLRGQLKEVSLLFPRSSVFMLFMAITVEGCSDPNEVCNPSNARWYIYSALSQLALETMQVPKIVDGQEGRGVVRS